MVVKQIEKKTLTTHASCINKHIQLNRKNKIISHSNKREYVSFNKDYLSNSLCRSDFPPNRRYSLQIPTPSWAMRSLRWRKHLHDFLSHPTTHLLSILAKLFTSELLQGTHLVIAAMALVSTTVQNKRKVFPFIASQFP